MTLAASPEPATSDGSWPDGRPVRPRQPRRSGPAPSGERSPSHLALLRHVRDLHRTASHGDHDALEVGLRRLRDALVRHVDSESEAFAHVVPAARRVVVRGQLELLQAIDDLLAATSTERLGRLRAAQLGRRLARQARLETRVLLDAGPWRSIAGWADDLGAGPGGEAGEAGSTPRVATPDAAATGLPPPPPA